MKGSRQPVIECCPCLFAPLFTLYHCAPWRPCRNSWLSLRNASQALWQSNIFKILRDWFAHYIGSQRHYAPVSWPGNPVLFYNSIPSLKLRRNRYSVCEESWSSRPFVAPGVMAKTLPTAVSKRFGQQTVKYRLSTHNLLFSVRFFLAMYFQSCKMREKQTTHRNQW